MRLAICVSIVTTTGYKQMRRTHLRRRVCLHTSRRYSDQPRRCDWCSTGRDFQPIRLISGNRDTGYTDTLSIWYITLTERSEIMHEPLFLNAVFTLYLGNALILVLSALFSFHWNLRQLCCKLQSFPKRILYSIRSLVDTKMLRWAPVTNRVMMHCILRLRHPLHGLDWLVLAPAPSSRTGRNKIHAAGALVRARRGCGNDTPPLGT